MMAPVDGSGSWPAWMQMVLNRAFVRSFTGIQPTTDVTSRISLTLTAVV